MKEASKASTKSETFHKPFHSDSNANPASPIRKKEGPDPSSSASASANFLQTLENNQNNGMNSPVHYHVEEFDGSQIGGYAPVRKPPQLSEPLVRQTMNHEKTPVPVSAYSPSDVPDQDRDDPNSSLDIGPNSSMSVNTGTPFTGNDDGENDPRENGIEFGMMTPQKDLLSPPAVTRKIDESQKRKIASKLFREGDMDSPIVVGKRHHSKETRNHKHHPFKIDYDANKRMDPDREDASSLISEYGSEVGEVKLRLEDVNAMGALVEEGEGEEDTEMEDDVPHRSSSMERNEATSKSQTKQSTERKFHLDGALNFSNTGVEINHVSVDKNSNDDDGTDDEDDDGSSQDLSICSVDLASQHDGPTRGGMSYVARKAMNEAKNVEHALPPERRAVREPSPIAVPSSPVSKRVDMEPSTPIGAVSAALRRFGNGVSNIRRFTKSPGGNGGESPGYHKHDDGFIYRQPREEMTSGVWLSPRFSNQKNHVSNRSIHQPRIVETPSSLKKKRGGVIASCLSFDPESGRVPYGNMRMTESPPASPLPPRHRKSKSWGSGGSEYFIESMKEIYQSDKMQWLDPNRPKTSHASGGLLRPNGAGFQPNRPVDCVLSPKRDILSSPKISRKPVVLLQSPQRVGDIEREDALDLLSLFVERSVAFHENSNSAPTNHLESDEELSSCNSNSPYDLKSSLDALREISKKHVDTYDCEGESADKLYPSHDDRMKALESLENSHTYAMEMNQAALSASTWLNAIGRNGKSPRIRELIYPNSSEVISEEKINHMNIDELRSLVQATHLQLLEKSDENEKLDRELSMCRAEIGRLNTMSRNEPLYLSTEKSILDDEVGDESSASSTSSSQNEFPSDSGVDLGLHVDDTLNDNPVEANITAASMADAKKEILLLKAELEETNRILKTMEQGIRWPKSRPESIQDENASAIPDPKFSAEDAVSDTDNPEKDLDDRTLDDTTDFSEPITKPNKSEDQEGFEENTSIMMDGLKEELEDYVTALRKADNEEIESLKKRIQHFESTQKEDENPEQKMINVRMLNAENFTTDWNRLSPLPPPPDHDLRSPIVADLLTQWTNDKETQESLLTWVENILNGQGSNIIPRPLKLSGLDHQVKEGFIMHILPFLLRRSDINVEVTTRAHRKTSYDMSVTIGRSHDAQRGSIEFGSLERSFSKSEMDRLSKNPHIMAFKASSMGATLDNSGDSSQSAEKGGLRGYISSALETGSVTSTTITAPISNQIKLSNFNNPDRSRGITSSPLMENDLSFLDGSINVDQTPLPQQGIMAGALNAMGGFISRRRTPGSQDNELNKNKPMKATLMTPQSPLVTDITSDLQKESQPYHRVVSAPPGRIGMTFVQYRGHAMISDVYKNSPLAGWVFPSDILIAIDEVPVSGMRVPEIVKLLTARKEQQRALRVISSHAMSELLITEDHSL